MQQVKSQMFAKRIANLKTKKQKKNNRQETDDYQNQIDQFDQSSLDQVINCLKHCPHLVLTLSLPLSFTRKEFQKNSSNFFIHFGQEKVVHDKIETILKE